MHLEPTDEGVQHLIERAIDGPIVMLNLLRFRDIADYVEHPELASDQPISGRQAYDRYMAHTMPYLTASGGSVDFLGVGGHYFIGPDDERWDMALLVRQDGLDDFFAFASNEGYLEGIGHRSAALADSRLLPLEPVDLPD